MGIGPGPGATYKVRCSSKSSHTVSFNGDISIAISGTPKQIEYYEFGKSYVFHARPYDGDQPDSSAAEDTAS